MKRALRWVGLAVTIGVMVALPFGCGAPPPSSVDGYVAVAPRVLRAGHTESISLTLLSGNTPASGKVRVALSSQDGQTLAEASSNIPGKGVIPLKVPRVPSGEYQLELRGPNFQDKATLRVEDGTLVFLETDKPIYKPGQKVLMRVLTLDPELRPLTGEVTVEVQDSKGTKVFKKPVQTDEYGMASLEMPLSTEPNLGVWKVTATSGNHSTQVDVRVEEYVLPKYEVKLDLPRSWFLASEPVVGKVSAEYSFGKPVKGEVQVVAKRYVGTWEQYATVTKSIDGQVDIELPPVRYVAGTPAAAGQGNMTLEVTVREQGTGYQEKTTSLLTVAATPVSLQVIPEGTAFKPSLPFTFLVVTETPDKQPLEEQATVVIRYMDKDFQQVKEERHSVTTSQGKALLQVTPPQGSAALALEATSGEAYAALALEASYSPSASFIHVEQTSPSPLKPGDQAQFKVHSTKEAANFYYEVVSRGKVVFTNVSQSPEISFTVTPAMAPSSRLLVYQLLPTSEVAADYLPFAVEASYPHQVQVGFSSDEVRPGGEVEISVQTQGTAKVGLVAVDRSVFILAEQRLNLQQVFQELERLYMQPQVELHSIRDIYTRIAVRGAEETFKDAGLLVLSNKKVPKGEEYKRQGGWFEIAANDMLALRAAAGPQEAPAAPPSAQSGLAEVQRVRQFFPETWLWQDVTTNGRGQARLPVQAPDSITTWVLRAIALSRENGLGIAESSLRVFQPFFLQLDLPYSVIRGEEFPVKVALYNYLNQPQEITVTLEQAGWFDLKDQPVKVVTVPAREVGGVQFTIRPKALGSLPLKVTAQSREAADAVVKELLVQPEGVEREVVENIVLAAAGSRTVDTLVPDAVVPDSARAYVTLTGSYLTQTMEGLEQLLRMPFGCGEQNMILMAPNTFILRYLKATNQLKPEVMAKAEQLMITGYQRQLTFRRGDGSFSAFGESDQEGSLWLTAFVLKTFAQAKGLIFVDDTVLDAARDWVVQHQAADGSFEPVGFVHHQELLGGLQGKDALTAFVAIALQEAGETSASARTVRYLEGRLASIEDAYTTAIVTYALELAGSPRAEEAYQKLMGMARDDGNGGLYWGEEPVVLDQPPGRRPGPVLPEPGNPSAAVEATGYAALALVKHGDLLNASRAARWLVGQRNAFGGFASTQDTVVGLQALTAYSTTSQADVDLKVTLRAGDWQKQVAITPENFDVLQVLDVPVGQSIEVTAEGKGQAVMQVVRRFNLPQVEQQGPEVFQIKVDYGTDRVEVNDQITVSVGVKFNPPEPVEAEMVVLDIAVPTGFSPVRESVQAAVQSQAKMKRFDVAGRKVIFYIEGMQPGEEISFSFQAVALYPVEAKAVASQAYSYYQPQWKGEALGGALQVVGPGQ